MNLEKSISDSSKGVGDLIVLHRWNLIKKFGKRFLENHWVRENIINW